jgi:hypothetical protein
VDWGGWVGMGMGEEEDLEDDADCLDRSRPCGTHLFRDVLLVQDCLGHLIDGVFHVICQQVPNIGDAPPHAILKVPGES